MGLEDEKKGYYFECIYQYINKDIVKVNDFGCFFLSHKHTSFHINYFWYRLQVSDDHELVKCVRSVAFENILYTKKMLKEKELDSTKHYIIKKLPPL